MGDSGNIKLDKSIEVGIEDFVGSHQKVSAVVKERFSDFHVYEIGPDGKQVHLTDLGPPKEVKKTTSNTDPELLEIVTEESRLEVDKLQSEIDKGNRKATPVEINVTNLDKQQRTKVHRWIANFQNLGSTTLDKGNDKFIVVQFASNKIRNARRPESRAKFTHCVMYKEGMDTSDAVMFIAKKLRMQPNLITYCGTKDKRAKTSQRICVSNIEARRLIEVSKFSRQVKLGNFEYQAGHLSLGDLKGNHFKLLLKNVKTGDPNEDVHAAVDAAVSSLKDKGFINYYGLQRFGSFEVPTHEIGKALLQGRWDKVFDLILTPKPREPEFMAEAKRQWFENRDAVEIVKKLPTWHRSIESNLLYGLSRHYDQKDYISAFIRIPRNVRLLYVHAFQSFLWNRVATFRFRQHGLKPVVGDLVYDKTAAVDVTEFEDKTLDIDVKNLDGPEVPGPPEAKSGRTEPPPVKVLKEEDLSSYTIFDVLIPLQGTEVKHPSPAIQEFYENLLLDSGLTLDCFENYKPRQDAPRGAYRQLIQLPTEVEYQIRAYGDSDNLDDFIISDVDRLFKPSKSKEPVDDKEIVRDKKCLVLEFSLPSSAYATMALREILDSAPEDLNSGKRSLDAPEEDNDDSAKKARTEDENNGNHS